MTDKLPTNLLALFQPRSALRYLQPADHAPEQRKTAPISGVAQFLDELRKPDPNYMPTESWLQQRDRKKREKKERQENTVKHGLETYNPDNDPHIRGDPYKTLFVSRLSYDVKEQDLEREFGRFGPIDRIRLVRNKDTKKPRGYAFILFEREKDMKGTETITPLQ
ncbi:Nucleolin [Orbilia brochopaga]|nr:Nucleolin [Drechslerella brochopaga]